MKPYLSVIIPAYNEEDNLRRGSLLAVTEYLSKQKFTWEIILVNDGSTDKTLEEIRKQIRATPNVQVLDNPHMGKQATVISGALTAKGDIILFSDMDQATPISEFGKFIPHLKSGSNIVIGSRSGRPNAPLLRKVLAYGNVLLRNLILNIPVKDSQCGFKAFTHDSAQRIFSIMNKIHPPKVVMGPAVNPGFDVELLYLGRKLGYKIAEIPVAWRHQETRRVSFVKDAIEGLTGLFWIRYRSLVNAYDLS